MDIENIFNVIENGDLQKLEFMIKDGTNIEVRDSSTKENTPLLYASEKGKLEIVKFLIGKGANIEAINSKFINSLAEALDHGHFEIAELLVESGANLEAKFSCENTLLLRCCRRESSLEAVKFLVKKGANLEAKNTIKYTPLLTSLCFCRLDTAKFLIENGADTTIKNIIGKDIMMYIPREKKEEFKKLIENHSCTPKPAKI